MIKVAIKIPFLKIRKARQALLYTKKMIKNKINKKFPKKIHLKN